MKKKPFRPVFSDIAGISGLKVTVMGLGLNGGGLASALFFARRGAEVTVTDMKTEEQLCPSIRQIEEAGVTVRYALGGHKEADFSTADLVIKNPGVKMQGNPYLAAASAVETDISVFLRLNRAPVIAVTGSKGKSSTAAAIHYGLVNSGFTAFLGGNITVSPLTFLEKTADHTPVVLELSSWQLGDLKGIGGMESPEEAASLGEAMLRPKIAVITPIVPDHQNWYGSMDAYVADKKIIYQGQNTEGWTICNRCDGWGEQFAAETKAKTLWYSDSPLAKELSGAWIKKDGTAVMRFPFRDRFPFEERIILPARLAVPGEHMKQNIMNAGQVLAVMGVSPDRIAEVLSSFPGVEHRLEFFHRWQSNDGRAEVLFYNDSAATVPEAAAAAVNAFDTPPIMICGGTDKELDFTPLAAALPRAGKIYLLAGSGTEKLISLLEQQGTAYEGPFSSIEETLQAIGQALPPEGSRTAVLSPGAASFGMFVNEFDRGNKFKEAVRKVFP